MDQMASACGEANKLLAMICQVCIITSYKNQRSLIILDSDSIWYCLLLMQPAEIVGLVEIPNHIRVWGIDSGIRHRLVCYYISLSALRMLTIFLSKSPYLFYYKEINK